MLSTKELNSVGYFVGFIPTMYNHIDNHMEHIIISGDKLVFRAYGRSICVVKNIEHLIQLTEGNKTAELSFKNYPIRNSNEQSSK